MGGLENADPVLERPGQVHSDDFVGCVHSVSINGRALNLSNPLASRGVKSTCVRSKNNPCIRGGKDAISLCGADAKCYDKWHQVSCRCGSVIAPNCGTALEPITLSEGGYIEFKVCKKICWIFLFLFFFFFVFVYIKEKEIDDLLLPRRFRRSIEECNCWSIFTEVRQCGIRIERNEASPKIPASLPINRRLKRLA